MDARFELAKKTIDRLKAKNLFLVPTESCSGGAVSDSITDAPGASDILTNGFIVYSDAAKLKLGVERAILEKHGVYSFETAAEMARAGLAAAARGDVGVGITGNLPGKVYIAVLYRDRSSRKLLEFEGANRRTSKPQIAETVLQMVLDLI